MARFGISQPVRRIEGDRLLRGQGQYIDDINLPGQARRTPTPTSWVLTPRRPRQRPVWSRC